MKIKKVLLCLISAAVCVSLCSCGNSTLENTQGSTTTTTTQQSIEKTDTTTNTQSETTTTAAQSKTTTDTQTEKKEDNTTTQERNIPNADSDKLIALTFDDGPNTTTTVQVLDILEEYNIPASFFLVGNNITDETEPIIRRAYDMGCEIDNHSKSHSYMDKMSADKIKDEISYVNDKVKEITGEGTSFFRPPYIAVSDAMFENIEMPFIAGNGCNDWDTTVSVEKRIKITMKLASDGSIVLLHDAKGNDQTVEALPQIIEQLIDEGYRFVTVSQLFEEKNIEPKSEIIYSYATQTTMYG